MNDAVRQQYDSLYATTDKTFGDGTPLKMLKLLQQEMPSGRILDVGGGDGRNAVHLAENGYEVVVVDLSQVGLDKIKRLAKEKSLVIDTHCLDITNDSVPGEFDGMLFSFMLHHLDTEVAKLVINKLKVQTKKGGVHLIATFGHEGGLADRALKTKRFYPSLAELKALYSDWQVVYSHEKEVFTLAKDTQGVPFKNQAIFFTAKKLVSQGQCDESIGGG